MKRVLWIFATVLVIAAGTLVALYLFRKNKALDQYVHPNSYAIVSVSLDDLLLDNLDQLFKGRKQNTVQDKSNLMDVENWWKAGIKIPAQVHFFSLTDDPLTFFTIQRIGDIGKWETFLKEHAVDSLQAFEDSQRLTRAQLSSHISMLYNEQYIVFRVGLSQQDSAEEILTVWSGEKDWVPLRDFRPSSENQANTHIVYYHTDGTFQLFADIAKNQIALSGTWQFASPLPNHTQARKSKESTPSFLSFWSALPLAETPIITKSLSVFSGIMEDSLIDNSYAYADLFISNQMTTQQDTIVVYDYDEDFNSIEKKEIQETSVPVIESLWKGNDELSFLLPSKLFYKLNKMQADSLVLLSTNEQVAFPPTFETVSTPFHLSVDFKNAPSSWDASIVRSLQQHNVKINLSTSVLDSHSLEMEGSIRYDEK